MEEIEEVEKKKKEEGKRQRDSFMRGLAAGLLVALVVVTASFLGKVYLLERKASMQPQSTQTAAESIVTNEVIQKMALVEDTILKYYLEDTAEVDLEEGVYQGMVTSLSDPYSAYYSAEDMEELMNQTEGIYYGIGAYIGIDAETKLPVLSEIIPNTPAEESGLQGGDLIFQVEDEYVEGLELSEVVSKVKGPEGTNVTLTIVREGVPDSMDFVVERRKIESPTVDYEMREDGIGYIRIKEFDDITLDQFSDAITVLQGNHMKGLLLDVRSNPGGNLSTVIEIARKILPKGMIVYTEDKYGERDEYKCDGSQELKIPLVVLINGNSASASEILAGSVKDYGIGTLVGTKTYGKGIVQRVISLSDGSAVKLTVSHYFTPNGNNIHKVGIEPDVEVELDAERYLEDGSDNQMEKAVEVLKEKIQE